MQVQWVCSRAENGAVLKWSTTCNEWRCIKVINNLQWMALYKSDQQPAMCVSQFVLAVRLVSKGTSVRIRFGSPFSSKIVVCGQCLVTLSITTNETFKWLSSLPILMQGSFWWWQWSDRYIISLSPPPPTSIPPSPLLNIPNKPHSLCGC